MLALIPAAMAVGRLITKTGSYRWAIWIGWVLTTLGTGLTILWDAPSSTTLWVLSLVFLGFGHGFLLNALNCASQAVCKPGDEGAAAAMYAFLRSFGMALGVGIGGSVFQNVMKIKLRALHLSTLYVWNAEAYLKIAILHTPPSAAVMSAYDYGFHGVFGFFCSLAGIALIACRFIKHFDINKELVTEHTLDTNSRIGLTLNRLNHSRTPSQLGSLNESVPEGRQEGIAQNG
jgi:MFS family permease